jgi:hypothetical protein
MEASQANPWLLIGTSAAIGAFVSSLVSEIGKWRERKSRQEDLLLDKAIDMAHTRFANTMQILKETNQRGSLMPEIEMVEDYHHFLSHLIKKGILPPDYKRNIPRTWEKASDEKKN